MTTSLPRPWWPTNIADAKALAVKFRADGLALKLFELLVVAAAMQDWDIFASAIEGVCDVSVRAIHTMLENQKFDTGWSLLYNGSGMPRELFPLFIEILKVARKFEMENSAKPTNRAFRLAVIQQALTSPALRHLQVPAELKTALLE